MTINYTDVFGNATLPPSEFKMQALALTAATTLYWPYNYTGTGSILAKINVLTSTGAYDLTFPDATQVSTGEDTLIILLVTSGLAHLPPIKVVTILAGVMKVGFVFFVLSCVIARGARFFALAWALRRFGQPIKNVIERRLGLIAGSVAVVMITLYAIVKYSGIAGTVTSC